MDNEERLYIADGFTVTHNTHIVRIKAVGAALVCTVGVGIWLMATWAFMNTGYGYTPLLFWLDAAAVVAAAVQTVRVKKSAG